MTEHQFQRRVQADIDAAVAQGAAGVVCDRMDRNAWPFVPSGYEDDATRRRRELVAANRIIQAEAAKLIRERKLEQHVDRPFFSQSYMDPSYMDRLRKWADEHGEQRDEFGER